MLPEVFVYKSISRLTAIGNRKYFVWEGNTRKTADRNIMMKLKRQREERKSRRKGKCKKINIAL